jgi:hypothetical protein
MQAEDCEYNIHLPELPVSSNKKALPEERALVYDPPVKT